MHEVTGWLHTEDGTILDAEEHPVRLLGMGFPDLRNGAGYPDPVSRYRTGCKGWEFPPPDAYARVKSYGFNSVRLAWTWANLEPTAPTSAGGKVVHHYNLEYLHALDSVVRRFTARGVAVVLDLHQGRWSPAFRKIPLAIGVRFCQGFGMPAWLYPNGGGLAEIAQAVQEFMANKGGIQQGFIDAWTFVARRYRANHLVVGADVLNEPYDILTAPYPGVEGLRPKDLNLVGFYERVGRALHEVNPNLLLIFEDNISRRTGLFAVTRPPDLPNAVYSLHFSQDEWQPAGFKRLDAYWRRAHGWGVPVWIGELTFFGASTPYPTDPNWRTDLADMLEYSKKRDISWTVWSFNNGWFLIPGGAAPKPDLLPILQKGF